VTTVDSPRLSAGSRPAIAHRDALEQRLDEYFLSQLDRSVGHDASFQELWMQLRRLAGGGKRVRPLLLLSTHRLLGGARDEDALRVALAFELLHTALMVHDDIIDKDLERRGGPNLTAAFASAAEAAGVGARKATAWGEASALLAGDLLLAAAVREVAETDLPAQERRTLLRIVDDGIFLAASGEQSDVAFGLGLEAADTIRIRTMMARKTAGYSFEAPLRAAAVLAGAPAGLGDRLAAVGRSLGVIFQMRDDLLGAFGDPRSTGKTDRGDLREGKRTLLVAFADGSPQWAAVAHLWGAEGLDDDGAAVLRSALESCGARERLERELEDEAVRTLGLIASAGLPEPLAAELSAQVRSGVERES